MAAMQGSTLPFNAMRTTPPPPPYVDTVGLNTSEYVAVESRDAQVFVVHRDCLCEAPLIRRAFAKRVPVHHRDVVVEFRDQRGSGNGHMAGGGVTAQHARSKLTDKDGEDEDDDEDGRSMAGFSTTAPTATMDGDGEADEQQQQHNNHHRHTAAAQDGSMSSRSTSAASSGTMATSTVHARSGTLAGSTSSTTTTMTAAAEVAAAASLLSAQRADEGALYVDATVRIHFPRTRGATLDTVLAYLYYKHRYEGARGDDVQQQQQQQRQQQQQQRPAFDVPVASALELMQLAAVLEC